jgi:hypothetical protein
MELTENQKKDLNRFSLIMNSLNYEDGLYWTYNYYDGYFEQLEGPNSDRGRATELEFLPRSIEEIFIDIRDNFDTDLFYNERYENYYGTLTIKIVPENQEIIVYYDYNVVNTEDITKNKSFKELADTTNPWRRGENVLLKLTNQDFINDLIGEYGSWVIIKYSGGGDSGYLDETESDSGNDVLNGSIEDIAYEALEAFFGGWENNEGSDGNMKFNFDEQRFIIEHYQYVEDNVEEKYKTISFK